MGKSVDLIGQRFGRLVVIEKSEKPTLYKKYIKETNVKASVKIEVV